MASAQLKTIQVEKTGIPIEPQNQALANQVDLEFTSSPAGQSYLSQQIAQYPYHIGRLLKNSSTPENMAMLYLQCTSGGLFEDDRIGLNITAQQKSVASVKHAAATVVHSMQQGQALTHLQLQAKTNAYLEYTGNLNIMFPNSHLNNQIDVELHPNAVALISDAYLIHDPTEQAQHFKQLDTTINVYNQHHKLLMRDRFSLSGTQLSQQLHAVSKHYDTHATIYILTPNCVSEQYLALLGLVQTSTASLNLSKQEAYIGVGALPKQSGVFVRIMCRSGQPVQQLVMAISQHLRTYILREN